MSTLLSIRDLKVRFRMGKLAGVPQVAEAVRGVSFDVPENTIAALVGESGSGKSVTAMSMLALLPDTWRQNKSRLAAGRAMLANFPAIPDYEPVVIKEPLTL